MKIWFFKACCGTALGRGLQIRGIKFLTIIVGLGAALLVITVLPGAALAQGPIEVLEEFPISYVYGPVSYAVSGDIVVFASPYLYGVYGYNLSTQNTFSITNQAGGSLYLNISGDTIVWHDYRNDNWDIYGYDLGKDREFQITNNAAVQACPAIDGNTVVWLDWRNGGDTYGDDIYGHNINTGTESRVTSPATTGIGCPDISGNTVVWSDSRNGTWNVYAYNLVSHTEVQITDGAGSTAPFYSAISGNVIVVGSNEYLMGWGGVVYGFDSSGNPLFEIRSGVVGLVAIDGNLVVWQEEPLIGPWQEEPLIGIGGIPYIVGYDITSGHSFRITDDEYEARFPKISGDVVVWSGCQHLDWGPHVLIGESMRLDCWRPPNYL